MMRLSSLGACVLLLFGLLLTTASSAYGDTISITTISLSNLQIIPTSGTVVISAPQSGLQTAAGAAAVNNFDERAEARKKIRATPRPVPVSLLQV